MSYVIGSFNLLKMNYQHNDKIAKEFKRIAEIINSENFDVVALQEVISESAMKKLLMPALGTNKWEYVWASPDPYTSSSNEGYAYIWRKRRLKLVEANDNPKIYNKYSIRGSILQGGLIRPPLVARFTPNTLPGGSRFEIRLINTHIIHRKPLKLDVSLTDTELRSQELRILSEEVYRLVSTKGYGNNMPSYTILMGDYNLCLAGNGPKIDVVIPIAENRFLKNVQIEKTTLKRPATSSIVVGDDEEAEEEIVRQEGIQDYYSKNYDHFSYEVSLLDKMRLVDSRVEALGKYYGNNLETYRREISDHVPIKLVIDLKLR